MPGDAEFESVPIVEVNSDNINVFEPVIRAAIANADFIAIDCVSNLAEYLMDTSWHGRYEKFHIGIID